MCGDCKKTIAAASASGPNAASNALANAHCRRSEVDEESQDVRFQRMMHMLIAFYKSEEQCTRRSDLGERAFCCAARLTGAAASSLRLSTHICTLPRLLCRALHLYARAPFTFQRMCDLLLEPRRYCKSTNKFLLAFSKVHTRTHMRIVAATTSVAFVNLCAAIDIIMRSHMACCTVLLCSGLRFLQLVHGINCDVLEDNFNVNWMEQKVRTGWTSAAGGTKLRQRVQEFDKEPAGNSP